LGNNINLWGSVFEGLKKRELVLKNYPKQKTQIRIGYFVIGEDLLMITGFCFAPIFFLALLPGKKQESLLECYWNNCTDRLEYVPNSDIR